MEYKEMSIHYLSQLYIPLSNFAMGTILGNGFAQAQVHTEMSKAQVLWTVCTSAWAKPFSKITVPMAKLHSLKVLVFLNVKMLKM